MDQAEIALMQKAASVLGGAGSAALVANASVADLYRAMQEINKIDDVNGVAKATFGQASSAISGLTAYDLEAPAKLFYPVLTPLRNMLPRTSGKGGIQAAWRAITGVNTGSVPAGVSEGNRNAVISVTTQDYIAAYRGLGMESNASFEAQYAGETFDDVRMRAAQSGLHSLMLQEERIILAGVGSLSLGTTPTPSLTASTTGGSLPTQTESVICVALTADAYQRSGGLVASGITPTVSRLNADGSTDTVNGGTAQKSANATVALTGPTASVTATVAAVRGAAAYAWFWGVAGSELLGAITTVPKVVITAVAAGTQTAASITAADTSANGLIYDGIITQALKSGSGSYWTDLGGATLTADGVGGVNEIDAVLKSQWDNYRLNPEIMWVSSQQAKDIRTKVMAGQSNGALRFNIDAKQGMIAGGLAVASYMNEYGLNGTTDVQIRQHPYITPGTILFTQHSLPYPLADSPNVIQMRMRQDYYQIEWPLRSRKYEYGVYADGVCQVYFPPAISVITGIAPG